MSNIIPFRKPAKKPARGNTLCKEGHHKWKIVQEKQFDSQQGKLVTIYACECCQKKKTEFL